MHRQKQAGVAQLVERQPSKLNVASSNLVSRSFILIFAEVAQLVERQPSKLNVASSNLVFRSAKRILDDNIKDFLLYKSCKTYYNRHELQALFIVGTSCKLAPAEELKSLNTCKRVCDSRQRRKKIQASYLIVDMSYKLYCSRHELQTLFIVGVYDLRQRRKRNAPAGGKTQ